MFNLNKIYSIDVDDIKHIFLWVSISGFFAVFYFQTVLNPNLDMVPNWFEEILQGNAGSPHNYRLLVPTFFSAIDQASPLNSKYDYFIATFICFLFSFAFLMRALAFHLSDNSSVHSLLFASFFILLTFPLGGVQPWSYVDIGLYSLAYLAITSTWKMRYYFIILTVAVFNRETGVLLSIVPLVISLLDKKCFSNVALYKSEFLIMFYGIFLLLFIRFFQGDAAHVITIEEVFLQNFSPVTFTSNLIIYTGAFFWLFIGGVVKLSNVEKSFIVILMINIGLILLFGLIREIRMFVPYVFLFGLIYSRRINKCVV